MIHRNVCCWNINAYVDTVFCFLFLQCEFLMPVYMVSLQWLLMGNETNSKQSWEYVCDPLVP